jgi:hypothetical protein
VRRALAAAASVVHDAWVERNPWADDALKVPYEQLPEAEKAKDREHVLAAAAAMAAERASARVTLPVLASSFTTPVGLPDVPAAGTRYLVSTITAQAAVDAGWPLDALVTVDATQRDASGNVVGAERFAAAPAPSRPATAAPRTAPPEGSQLVNLTGRQVEFFDPAGVPLAQLPPAGPAASARNVRTELEPLHGVPRCAIASDGTDLPAPRDGVVLLVNVVVARAALAADPSRTDLVVTSGSAGPTAHGRTHLAVL